MVKAQQAAQALAANHRQVIAGRFSLRPNREQSVAKSLVITLEVIVFNILGDRGAKMPLSQYDHLVKALALYRQNESLGVRIQIGTSRRQLHALDSSRSENCDELHGEERVPIVEEVALPLEKSVDRLDEGLPGHPFPPRRRGLDAVLEEDALDGVATDVVS